MHSSNLNPDPNPNQAAVAVMRCVRRWWQRGSQRLTAALTRTLTLVTAALTLTLVTAALTLTLATAALTLALVTAARPLAKCWIGRHLTSCESAAVCSGAAAGLSKFTYGFTRRVVAPGF